MGRGIYRHRAVDTELELLRAGSVAEGGVIASMIVSGDTVPLEQTVDGVDVSIAHHTGKSGRWYVLVGRFAMYVRPVVADACIDSRGSVDAPDAWFTEAADNLACDLYNVEVVALRRWAVDPIRLEL